MSTNRWRAPACQRHQAYIYELPNLGRGDIVHSATGLAAFADKVRAETGTDKVDLVGHSQGGLVVPVATATLNDGATNVRIQDQLPDNRITHPGLPSDPAVHNGIEDALRGEP